MRQILFLLSSARADSNSTRLARRAAPADAVWDWLDVTRADLPALIDSRPVPAAPLCPVLANLAARMRAAEDLVIVAPVYWYALPAPAKLMIDHWSGFLETPGLGFAEWIRGKRLWLITTRADPDPTVPDQMEAALARSGRWLGMAWCGALHGLADAPGDIVHDTGTWAAAQEFLTLRT